MFWRDFTITGSGEADHFMGMIVTADIFDTVGVRAQAGRTFTPSDLQGPPVAVISHQFWQERFGRAPDILGRTLTLNSEIYQVIGVMPASFSLRMENQSFDPKVFTLIQPPDPEYTPTALRPVGVIARLRDGVDMASAEAELRTLQTALDAQHPQTPKDLGVFLTSLHGDNLRFIRASLVTLSAAVALVLLVACSNIAGLLLGRATYRRREMALRAALGSGRGRLVLQLLAESLVLALMGAALGLLFAYAGVRAFAFADPFHQLPPDPIAINGRALLAALVLALLNVILFGVVPALEASRVDLIAALRSRGEGRRAGTIRSVLVVSQLALSLMLVAGAALLTKTLAHLLSQPLGFRTDHISVTSLVLPGDRYAHDAARLTAFYDQVRQRIAVLPGVRSVAISTTRPLAGGQSTAVAVAGRPEPAPNELSGIERQVVMPGFFETLSTPLMSGRAFTDRDVETSPPVAMINELLSRSEFSGTDPVGQRIKVGDESQWRTIVGVAGTMRTIFYNTLTAKETPQVFLPARQSPKAGFNPVGNNIFILARTNRPLTQTEIRREIDSIDKDVPVTEIKRMDEFVSEATRQPRFRTTLLAGFAVLALVLSAMGIYGLIAQNTAQRTGEIGIRMALGAQPENVLLMIFRQGILLAAAGTALGTAGALIVARALPAFLYGASGSDPLTYSVVCVLVLAIAALATYLPARRASRVDPMLALREE
jgi:putative ABC transport system permease protein